jgi:hypothetical protein
MKVSPLPAPGALRAEGPGVRGPPDSKETFGPLRQGTTPLVTSRGLRLDGTTSGIADVKAGQQ